MVRDGQQWAKHTPFLRLLHGWAWLDTTVVISIFVVHFLIGGEEVTQEEERLFSVAMSECI